MCNNASMIVLFRQSRQWSEDYNFLSVELRKWTCDDPRNGAEFYTLDTWITVEGKDITSKKLLNDCFYDHQAIRAAIVEYDRNYASHPASWVEGEKREAIHCDPSL